MLNSLQYSKKKNPSLSLQGKQICKNKLLSAYDIKIIIIDKDDCLDIIPARQQIHAQKYKI